MPPGGLANIGNTCSINSLVQCFLHVSGLRESLLSGNLTLQQRKEKAFIIGNELADIGRMMWLKGDNLEPRRFVHALYDALGTGIFRPGEQHDICELWIYLCDALLEEAGTKPGLKEWIGLSSQVIHAIALEDRVYADMTLKAHSSWMHFNRASGGSSFHALVQGLTVSQVQCHKCGYICHNFEPFTILPLDIPVGNANSVVPFSKCFQTMFKSEKLDEWTCDKCKEKQSAERLVRIWKAPQVLAFSLKRFEFDARTGAMNKVRTPVEVPMDIHFLEGSILNFQDMKMLREKHRIQYDLRAVELHYGGVHGGHYTSMGHVGGEGDAWAFQDDINVRLITKKQAEELLSASANAYLLLYERA